jgi:hypothetical protein
MHPALRNVFTLTGCLVVVGVAGGMATLALRSATVAPTQVATATVVVASNDASGAARLTVLDPVRFNSGGGQRVVAAGTQFVTANSLLVDSLPPPRAVAVGDTLSCDLRVSMSRGQPVLDLVRCAPARTSARG